MFLSYTIPEIVQFCYEIGAYITKNDLEQSFWSYTAVEIVAHLWRRITVGLSNFICIYRVAHKNVPNFLRQKRHVVSLVTVSLTVG